MEEINKEEVDIEVTYSAHATINIPDLERKLDIKWENVTEWFIKYCEMHIKVNTENGLIWFSTQIQPEVDYKWPIRVTTYDKDGKQVNVEISSYLRDLASEV